MSEEEIIDRLKNLDDRLEAVEDFLEKWTKQIHKATDSFTDGDHQKGFFSAQTHQEEE